MLEIFFTVALIRKGWEREIDDSGVVGIKLAELKQFQGEGKRLQQVVGVASGAHKAEAIIAAIRGGYINALVTDQAAAKKIKKLIASS